MQKMQNKNKKEKKLKDLDEVLKRERK